MRGNARSFSNLLDDGRGIIMSPSLDLADLVDQVFDLDMDMLESAKVAET